MSTVYCESLLIDLSPLRPRWSSSECSQIPLPKEAHFAAGRDMSLVLLSKANPAKRQRELTLIWILALLWDFHPTAGHGQLLESQLCGPAILATAAYTCWKDDGNAERARAWFWLSQQS